MQTKQLEQYINVVTSELTDFATKIDTLQLLAASNLISQSKKENGRLHVTGVGKPSHVAEYVAALNSSVGTPTYFLDTTEAVHGSLGQVRAEDIVIVISNSGETTEVKAMLKALEKIGAKTIGVSGGEDSWLKENSDVFLFAGVQVEGDELNKPPRASILAEIMVLQCLSILLQQEKELDLAEYYLYHPGGKLGESICEMEGEK
ncbi:D-arabinose 5-phosphate isomerase GutQ [Enterococcus sp. PF1-24]|uniref:SIS domain-containing protein n=1 Tax=unclassified Enterococcus TaxID=2608891 RepID=UPI002475B1CB|nr:MULTISPECIES: SIS domain-containing protein [unclassified Enterococcus]MDH6365588.1 D-arabinose 5-phosphate isomerase GutQ [Enterococcus sp. PFB1-1]MDH6402696.1 D-arabinose 5-phosphate isomerase GutQ [Enterococcus sp. PF1-24]